MFVSAEITARVRSGPSESAPVIGAIPRGTLVQVIERQGDWCKVTCSLLASEGWVHGTLLAESMPAAPPTQMPAPAPVIAGNLEVHFVDVGQGDSILIKSPEGKTALIDGGDTDTGIVSYLRSQGVQALTLVVATHPHADHIGGLVEVLRAFPVDEVVTNGVMHTTSTYERFLDAIADARAIYTEAKQGDVLQLGSLSFHVLHPQDPAGSDLNDQSLVLRLVHGQVAFLFTGDVQPEGQASILGSNLEVGADILKVAHHGSRTSSQSSFLSEVEPEVAIYSCGLGNSYGHPHPETIAALERAGAAVYGTDVNGTIVVTSNGSSYRVAAAKQSQAKASPVVPVAPSPVPTTAKPTAPTIEVLSLTSPIDHGANATLSIKTAPGAACTITVYYKSGASEAAGLGPQNADGSGVATWRWKVGTRTTPGTWRIVVTATIAGQRTTRNIDFEVR